MTVKAFLEVDSSWILKFEKVTEVTALKTAKPIMDSDEMVRKEGSTMGFAITDTLGDIVAQLPKAGEVFQNHRIDFCCGGNRALFEAAGEQNVDATQLVQELNALLDAASAADANEVDWTTAPLSQLVDHVLNRHHAYLNTTLPTLGELVTKILRVHGQNHAELAKVHQLFYTLKMEFEQHLIKEETLVFPKIVAFERTGSKDALEQAVAAIDELEKEHDSSGQVLKELRKVTRDYAVPDDGCGTYHYTFQKLEEVESNTFVHIHLENNILFPRLQRTSNAQSA